MAETAPSAHAELKKRLARILGMNKPKDTVWWWDIDYGPLKIIHSPHDEYHGGKCGDWGLGSPPQFSAEKYAEWKVGNFLDEDDPITRSILIQARFVHDPEALFRTIEKLCVKKKKERQEMIQTLDRKAMLVHLGISLWSARKYDRKVSDEVTVAKQADSRAARVNKHLFGGPVKAHQAVVSAAGKAREIHYRLTLPWGDTGWRLLPVTTYMEYRSEMMRAQAEFDARVAEFVAEYPDLRNHAKDRMGDLFDETDYPAAVSDRFSIRSSFMPVPVTGDFRVELGEAVVQQVQEETRKDVERMCQDAMKDVWARLKEVVEKAADKLAVPDAIFRDSLIGNIKAMATLARKLNLDNDPDLEWAASQAQILADVDAQTLRDHAGVRSDVHQRMAALVDKMKGTW